MFADHIWNDISFLSKANNVKVSVNVCVCVCPHAYPGTFRVKHGDDPTIKT